MYASFMGYGLQNRTALFEELCVEIPELRRLENDVLRSTEFLAMEDPRPTTQDDTDLIWYRLFKPRLVGLVGWTSKSPSQKASTIEAYDVVWQYLYRALAPSNETLGEASGFDEWHRNFERAQECWDGSEDTAPDFISREKVMQALVEHLASPPTDVRFRSNDGA
jgi:hypothetical protein